VSPHGWFLLLASKGTPKRPQLVSLHSHRVTERSFWLGDLEQYCIFSSEDNKPKEWMYEAVSKCLCYGLRAHTHICSYI